MKNFFQTAFALFIFMGIPFLGVLVFSIICVQAMIDLGWIK